MFANKEEALSVIVTHFAQPEYVVHAHQVVNGCYMFRVQRADNTRIGSIAENISVREVVQLLRVTDCTAYAEENMARTAVTFALHVEAPSLPRPRSAFSILEAALILLDPHIRANADSFTEFKRDPATGCTTFTVIADVERAKVEQQARSLEAYLQHYGVQGPRVAIAEIRRRPPFTRYDQTRITVTIATDELDVVQFNREAIDFQEVA